MTKKHSLWLLALSPVVWSLHFTAVYITAAIWCAKFPGTDLQKVRYLTAIYTLIAMVIVGQGIIVGYRKHTGSSAHPHHKGTLEGRERFLGLTRFLISSLSFLAIVYNAYAVYVFRSCE